MREITLICGYDQPADDTMEELRALQEVIMERQKREKIWKLHKGKIVQGKDGRWRTYLRKIVMRKI